MLGWGWKLPAGAPKTHHSSNSEGLIFLVVVVVVICLFGFFFFFPPQWSVGKYNNSTLLIEDSGLLVFN